MAKHIGSQVQIILFGTVHIPLIIHGAESKEADGFVSSPDILATISDITGVTQHPSWIGQSVESGGRICTTMECAGSGVSDIGILRDVL